MQPDSILVNELRAARISASPELRVRVAAIAARQPEPSRLRARLPRLGWRRAGLVLAPAAVVVVAGIAVAGGVIGAFSSPSKPTPHALDAVVQPGSGVAGATARPAPVRAAKAPATGTVAPSTSRAQSYNAELRLRVASLSDATKRALALTRSFHGYVRSVDFGSGTESGTAELVLRIPVGSVQAAIVRFSALGTILDQHVTIRDLQPQLDARFRQLQALRAGIAKVQQQLAGPNLPAAVRSGLEARLAQLRAQLAALQHEQTQVTKRASFATAYLGLSTKQAVVAPPAKQGRLGRALDHAGRILLKALVVVVYVVVVGGPFALLGLLLLAGERVRRRRSAERLLATR